MLKPLITIALMFSIAQPQEVIIARRRHVGACTIPAGLSNDWPTYNPSNLCAGSVPCTNGAVLTDWVDIVGGVFANAWGGAATYQTNFINSQPAINFNTGDASVMNTGITVPATTTLWALVQPATTTGILPIFGASSGTNSVEYRIENGKQEIVNAGVAILVTGAATLSTTSPTLIKAVVTATSANVFICSAGSCSSDGSATFGSQTFSNPINEIGTSGGDTDYQGIIVETGLGSGTVTGIEGYVLCKYAH